MKTIRKASEIIVYKHWKKHDSNNNEAIRMQLRQAKTKWHLAQIDQRDIAHINIIYASDWCLEYRLAVDGNNIDHRLNTVTKNYKKMVAKFSDNKRVLEIRDRERRIMAGQEVKRLILVTNNNKDFVIMEGNRRAIALNSLNELAGTEVYLGVFPEDVKIPSYNIKPEPMTEEYLNLYKEGIYQYMLYNRIHNGIQRAFTNAEITEKWTSLWADLANNHETPLILMEVKPLTDPYFKIKL